MLHDHACILIKADEDHEKMDAKSKIFPFVNLSSAVHDSRDHLHCQKAKNRERSLKCNRHHAQEGIEDKKAEFSHFIQLMTGQLMNPVGRKRNLMAHRQKFNP